MSSLITEYKKKEEALKIRDTDGTLDTRIGKLIGSARTDRSNAMELLARANPAEYFQERNKDMNIIETEVAGYAKNIAQRFAKLGIPDDEAINMGVSNARVLRDQYYEAFNIKYGLSDKLKNKIDSYVQGSI